LDGEKELDDCTGETAAGGDIDTDIAGIIDPIPENDQ